MKNLAVLAVILSSLSAGAYAESAVSEAPELTLAMNSKSADLWIAPAATAVDTKNEALANQIELKAAENMEKVSAELDKRLEEKIAKELDYAMQ